MKIFLTKLNGGLYPANEEAEEYLKKIPLHDWVTADIVRPRNIGFHRKWFALLHVGFEAWEPEEKTFRNMPVQKQFERFRKDVTIAAGYYDPVVNLKGEVRAEAKSISFGSMSEDDFEKLYSNTINVLLQYVLKNYHEDEVRELVDYILSFDG